MRTRFPVYAAILFASWNFNLLGIADSVQWSRCEPRSGYTGTEAPLVLERMQRPDLPPLAPMCLGSRPYLSQFGAQGILFTALGLHPETLAAICALLTACVAAGIFAAAHRDLGAPVGDVACVAAALIPAFLAFAPGLYWVSFTLLLPFAIVWIAGPHAGTPRKRLALLGFVGAAAYMKSLCGYEYVTAVTAAPAAAAWFHLHRTGAGLGAKLKATAAIGAVGVAGFALALATHVAQVEWVVGTDGVAAIRERAVARTAASTDGEIPEAFRGGMSKAAFAASCFRDYFHQRAFSLPSAFGSLGRDIPLKHVALFAAAFLAAVAARGGASSRDAAALAGALAVGFAASASWQVLAWNHMCVHRHLNMIVFAVPFLPLACIALGFSVKFCGAKLGPVLIAATAAFMLWNAMDAQSRSRIADASKAEAEAAFHRPIHEATSVRGEIDSMRPAGEHAASLLVEWGAFDGRTGGPADPNATIVRGWVLGPDDAPPALVAASGDRVLESRTIRYRRIDVDWREGRPSHRAGFVMIVSGTPTRILAAPENDPMQLVPLVKK